ncbi:hypothetical protein AB0C93_14785 [Streptomyces sp. NPDC048518]|uniref:hypothetical protein n=1 Tax=Streptomyces sp. NPDC048518 TaxID=3155029 RepID=UPI00340F0235
MSWNGAIEPAKIPQFTGDLELLEQNSTTLTAGAALFRIEGALVHSDFQGLAAFYETPEADDLFATTKPVADKSDAFADDLEKVATALSDYATEVRPLAAKLERLKDEAVKFCWSEIAGDDDWRQDQDKLDRNNELEEDVKATQLAFWAAEITCHNKIMALVGGVQLHLSDDGRTDCTTYGYTADVLDQAELPWGTPAEREYTGWAAFRHNLKSLVWDGFIMDGVVGTAKGLGSLVGTDGWDGMKKSWTGLAKLTTGLALTLSPLGVAYWTMPGDKLPSWLRDSRTAVKETGKALVAYDQWGKNPARAAGAVSFNVITTIATGGAGAAAKSGAAAKAIAAVGKTGRLVDPVMYAVKGSQFAIKGGKYAINTGKIGALKVGDLFNTLKGAGAGGARIKVPGATSTTYTLADEATAQSARYAGMPEGALPLTDNHGRPAYMDEGGAIRDLDHKPLQLPDEVTKTRNADTSTHTDVTSVHDPHHEPVMAGSRAGDGAGETAGRPGDHIGGGAGRDAAGGAASHRPHGPSGGFTHGPSAGHQNPGSGHPAGPGNGDHVPGGAGSHDGAGTSGGEHGTSGHDGAGTHHEGGAASPTGANDAPAGVTAPESPRGNLPDGSWAGESGLRLPQDANAAADDFLRQSAEAEPRITDTLQQITRSVDDGRMIGLDYRLKGEDSLKRKLATDLLRKSNMLPEEVLGHIRDSIRYTVEFPAQGYVHGVQNAVDTLRARGFENVTFKNTWDSPGYKGINSTWRDPASGRVFEVQFHTPESFVAKMETHVLYEKGRLPGVTGDELRAINDQQNELFDQVPAPHGDVSIDLTHELPTAHPPLHDGGTGLGRHSDQSVHGNGPPPELTEAERSLHDARLHELAERHLEDFDWLKHDPDHKGVVKESEMDEARVALDMRESRKLPPDIQRPPAANQGDLYSPSAETYYDIKGVHSDWPPYNNVRDKSLPYKDAYDPANNESWVRRIGKQIDVKDRTVILDVRNANQAAIDDLKAMVEQHGWSDRVVWYP